MIISRDVIATSGLVLLLFVEIGLGLASVWCLIACHQFGHFLAARLVGLRVAEIRIGTGLHVLRIDLLGCRFILRPLWREKWSVGQGDLGPVGGPRLPLRFAIAVLGGPLGALSAVVLLAFGLRELWERSPDGVYGAAGGTMVSIGCVALLYYVLLEIGPDGSGQDDCPVLADLRQARAVLAMSRSDAEAWSARWEEQAEVQAAHAAAWKGDPSRLLAIDPESLPDGLQGWWHATRILDPWVHPPDDVLESLERSEELARAGVAKWQAAAEREVAGKRTRVVGQRVGALLSINRAFCLAALHSRDPERLDNLREADELTRGYERGAAPRADGLHTRGLVLLQLGRLRAARECLERAFTAPVHWTLRGYQATYLAVCAIRDDRPLDAAWYFRKARAIDPQGPAQRFFGPEIEAGLRAAGVPLRGRSLAGWIESLLVLCGAGLLIQDLAASHRSGAAVRPEWLALGADLAYLLPFGLLVWTFGMQIRADSARGRQRRADARGVAAWRLVRVALAFAATWVHAVFGGPSIP